MKKHAEIFFVVLFGLFIAAVISVTVLNFGKTTSFVENRTLAKIPEFSSKEALSGGYFSAWETYLTDHAAARNTMLKMNTWTGMKLLSQPVVNGIVVKDDLLLQYLEYGRWDTSYLDEGSEKMASNLKSLSDYIAERGGSYFYVGVPEQFSYFRSQYPEFLENRDWIMNKTHSIFAADLYERNVNYLDMDAEFDKLSRPAEYYFATDHHYSYLGAFVTCQNIIETINKSTGRSLPNPSLDAYDLTVLPNTYLGSRERKLYGLSGIKDKAIIGTLKEPIKYTRFDNGIQTDVPLFNLPQTDAEIVTYELYMGGDKAETIIKTDRPELPNVLIYGDSFTNAAETILYASFNETRSLDFRYYSAKTLRQYIDEYKPDIVICIRDDTCFFNTDWNGQTGADD